MPCPLFGYNAIEISGKFYIAGGETEVWNDSNSIYRFDSCKLTWTEETSLHGSNDKVVLRKCKELLYVLDKTSMFTYDISKGVWLEVIISNYWKYQTHWRIIVISIFFVPNHRIEHFHLHGSTFGKLSITLAKIIHCTMNLWEVVS